MQLSLSSGSEKHSRENVNGGIKKELHFARRGQAGDRWHGRRRVCARQRTVQGRQRENTVCSRNKRHLTQLAKLAKVLFSVLSSLCLPYNLPPLPLISLLTNL